MTRRRSRKAFALPQEVCDYPAFKELPLPAHYLVYNVLDFTGSYSDEFEKRLSHRSLLQLRAVVWCFGSPTGQTRTCVFPSAGLPGVEDDGQGYSWGIFVFGGLPTTRRRCGAASA